MTTNYDIKFNITKKRFHNQNIVSLGLKLILFWKGVLLTGKVTTLNILKTFLSGITSLSSNAYE